jgi:hypothetical protein
LDDPGNRFVLVAQIVVKPTLLRICVIEVDVVARENYLMKRVIGFMAAMLIFSLDLSSWLSGL